MGVGGGEDPLENMVEGAMVFLACGGVEGSPNVALVSWGVDVKVMKPVKDRRPCGWKSLRERCSDDCGVGLGVAGGMTSSHM